MIDSSLAVKQGQDPVELGAVRDLRLGHALQVSLDLVEPDALTEHAATESPHVLVDVVEHGVDGMHVAVELAYLAVGFRHAGSVRHQREAT